MRLIAVPDIHGDFHALQMLTEHAEKLVGPDIRWVFLGDMIDRGLFSVEVLRHIKKLEENGHVALRGNHEELLDEMIDRVGLDEIQPRDLRFGLDNTIESFEFDADRILGTGYDLQKYLKESGFGPWLESLPFRHFEDGICFTHAPVPQALWESDGGPSDEECCWPKPPDLEWETLDAMMGAPEGHIAVCGHVVLPPHAKTGERNPVRVSNGVFLDCGCGSREDGRLICAVFEGGEQIGFLTQDDLLPVDTFD